MHRAHGIARAVAWTWSIALVGSVDAQDPWLWYLDDDPGADTVLVEEGDHTIRYSSGRVFRSSREDWSKGTFIELRIIDAPLLNERNRAHRIELEDSLFKRTPEARVPEGGLDLLLQLVAAHAWFDTVGTQHRYEPRWFPLPAKHDTIYRIFLIGEQAGAVVDGFFGGERTLENGQGCWMIYYGHNHLSHLQRMNSRAEVIVPIGHGEALGYTAHGVFIRQPPRESWCFISDDHVLPEVGKLRWPTIDTVLWDAKSATLIIQRSRHLEIGKDLFRCDPDQGLLTLIGKIGWREEEGEWEDGPVIARFEGRTLVVSPRTSPGTIIWSYDLDH